MKALESIASAKVVPVVEIDDAADAVALAHALLAGGIEAVEITLRTPAGIEAIRAITRGAPGIWVGAGTVLDPQSAENAARAGARFLVSPGFSRSVSRASHELGIPLIPGAVTATEVLTAMDAGHRVLKFFPAAASGGRPALRSLAAPFAHTGIRFMPTGGIGLDALSDYLVEPSVLAVGGTWIAGRGQIRDHRWDEIETAAREASEIARSTRTRQAARS